MLDALESLSGQIIFETLRENFPPLEQRAGFTTQEATHQLGVTAGHSRLFQRLLQILSEDRYLQQVGDRWVAAEVQSGKQPLACLEQLEQMVQEHPDAVPELTLFGRCGERLLQVLRGETDPLTLLFPSDGSVSAGNLYRDSIGGQAMNALVAQAVERIAADLPDGRGLRILEVGAGTGSTTESIITQVSDQRVQYVFTDIAASFLPAARAVFTLQEYAIPCAQHRARPTCTGIRVGAI